MKPPRALLIKGFIFVFYSIFVAILSSCNTLEGHRGASSEIEDSKKKGVFIQEYTCENPNIINDTLQILIDNAWLEREWYYGSNQSEIIVSDSSYQLIVQLTDASSFNSYSYSWLIGVEGNRYFRRCGRNCLITDFKNLPNDVESWPIQNGSYLNNENDKVIIGNFFLVKK